MMRAGTKKLMRGFRKARQHWDKGWLNSYYRNNPLGRASIRRGIKRQYSPLVNSK